jgi:hypothetical protein
MEKTELRPVFDGLYSVSADGRVWSERLQRFLNPSRHSRGYLEVRLTKDGAKRNFLVHRLVGLAWIENPRPDAWTCINHLNGDKSDNRAENLEWCDHARNNQHAHDIGKNKSTPAHKESTRLLGLSTRSLSEDQVREIRRKHSSGQSVVSIAYEFAIPRTTASSVVHRHNYRNVN